MEHQLGPSSTTGLDAHEEEGRLVFVHERNHQQTLTRSPEAEGPSNRGRAREAETLESIAQVIQRGSGIEWNIGIPDRFHSEAPR